MNQSEAKNALEQGSTIRHEYFSPEEWVRKQGCYYAFEDGNLCTPEQFWQGRDWDSGWSIVT